jgi:hypothetical protein
MKRKQRIREIIETPPDEQYWNSKAEEGWRLVAIEWEREPELDRGDDPWMEEVPYGLKVGEDCLHLVENSAEREAMTCMLEMIVADKPFSEIAASVNCRGFRTRAGTLWTQVDIFLLLPRLVEVAPRIYPTHDWSKRRERIYGSARWQGCRTA